MRIVVYFGIQLAIFGHIAYTIWSREVKKVFFISWINNFEREKRRVSLELIRLGFYAHHPFLCCSIIGGKRCKDLETVSFSYNQFRFRDILLLYLVVCGYSHRYLQRFQMERNAVSLSIYNDQFKHDQNI